MSDTASSHNTQGNSWRKTSLDAFLLFFLFSTVLMAWPQASPLYNRLASWAVVPLHNLGLWHRLKLFAPPPHYTGHLEFWITYQDRRRERWDYPRQKLAPWDGQPDSYQRNLFVYLCWNANEWAERKVLPLCQYLAIAADGPGHHPIKIEIVQKVAKIPAPELGAGRPVPQLSEEWLVGSYDLLTRKVQMGNQVGAW